MNDLIEALASMRRMVLEHTAGASRMEAFFALGRYYVVLHAGPHRRPWWAIWKIGRWWDRRENARWCQRLNLHMQVVVAYQAAAAYASKELVEEREQLP